MSNTIEPIIDMEVTFPMHKYIGKTALCICQGCWPHTLLDAANRMCTSGNAYAQFAGVTVTGSFLWNTGVGLWETN